MFPTTLLEIFPFIILISTQLFFLEIIKKKENELIKINNLDNFYLIKILALCSFIFGNNNNYSLLSFFSKIKIYLF